MDVMDAIGGRRSIRKFARDPIDEELVRKIVEAGLQAPSAGNLQSRRFYVVRDDDLRKKLARAALGQNFISQAPVAIVVCADRRIKAEYGERGVELYALLDCAAAVQNLMLAAYAHGLGTCWVGAFDEEPVTTILNLPEYLRPVTIVPLGVPLESPPSGPTISFPEACTIV